MTALASARSKWPDAPSEPSPNHLISNEIHNPVLKTSLVFAGFFCYNCKREKKGRKPLIKMSTIIDQHILDELTAGVVDEGGVCLSGVCRLAVYKMMERV